MMSVKERIATMISNNIKPSVVARALNISDSYISDLVAKDERFQVMLQEKSSGKVEDEIAINEGYTDIEMLALQSLADRMPTADVRELTQALDAVNKRNTRVGGGVGGSGQGAGGGSVIVAVQLPNHMMQKISIEVNARNEIVGVDGQNMASLTPSQLTDRLNEQGKDIALQTQDVTDLEISDGGDSYEQRTEAARKTISSRLGEIERVTADCQC